METEMSHQLNAVELQESISSTSSACGTVPPVQVVKPTLRRDKDVPDMSNTTDDTHNPEESLTSGVFVIKSDVIRVDVTSLALVESDPVQTAEMKEDDPEFEWNDYLDATGSTAAPPTAFAHVECSLLTLFSRDTMVEVPNRPDDGTYWVASVVMPCGPLLRLRHVGFGEDRSADFWCEIALGELRPVGYCADNDKTIRPPAAVLDKVGSNWADFLKSALEGATHVPAYLLDTTGCTAVDQIKTRMKLEVQDETIPTNVWIASVVKNVGGRLLLRYDGVDDGCHDTWLFYLSFRLHPVGWARLNQYQYKPPSAHATMHTTQEWADVLRASLSGSAEMPVPAIIFKNQEKVFPHSFKEGMKLEAIHPKTLTWICPATVSKIWNQCFFEVEIDEEFPPRPEATAVSFCCHSNSSQIFPVGWAKSNALEMTPPKGWSNESFEFDWREYLKSCSKESDVANIARVDDAHPSQVDSDHGLEPGMKLESVNPFKPHEICASTITKVVRNLIWLRLDNAISSRSLYILAASSCDIYPVGWCESNRYPLQIPLSGKAALSALSSKKVAVVLPKKQKRKLDDLTSEEARELFKGARDNQATGKAWCPEIYVNHKCFSGPFLSKARIAGLPKHVGPGPVTLVLKEIVSQVVGVSYISSRVLSVLQVQGEPASGTQSQLIKAKYKGRTFSAMVEIATNSDRVAEFCQTVCRKLQCCPNLFGPVFFGDECPEKCYSLRKTAPVLKKRKKKRKNKMLLQQRPYLQKISTGDSNELKITEDGGGGGVDNVADASDESPRVKRKYIHRTVPKSDIVTRGAQLPNFALQLRRRRRKSSGRTYLSLLNKSLHHKPQSPVKANIVRGPVGRPRKIQLTALSSSVRVLHLREPLNFPLSTNRSRQLGPYFSAFSSADVGGSSALGQVLHPAKDSFRLTSNPIEWSTEDVFSYIKKTDCAAMARLLMEQEIDGQALMLLSLPTIQEHLELKLGPAIKLCHHIERIKMAFYSQFASRI